MGKKLEEQAGAEAEEGAANMTEVDHGQAD